MQTCPRITLMTIVGVATALSSIAFSPIAAMQLDDADERGRHPPGMVLN